MKKLFVCFLLLIGSFTLVAQTPTLQSPTKQDYLRKSRGQKVTAWILVGAGASMIAYVSPGQVSLDVLPFFAIGGAASVLGSIPLFVAAGRNKRKAFSMSTSLGLNHYHNFPANKIVTSPTLTIRLRF
ncbi:hypothetical protein [Saccharicrinis sp. 156]|uniref:hypothetical protein n=1 Tax=Saccharicrinis sp. 156 TaxID=3417574 RepID=UPI003D326A67